VSDNADFDESVNDVGGPGQTLSPTEALDSDDVRNDDGDDVVDPPDHWVAADRELDDAVGETLDEKLAEEEPDITPDDIDDDDADDERGDTVEEPDDVIDRTDPEVRGVDEGQIDGTPEDGDSFFPVVE
jgi:hypothetical protein